MTFSKGVCKLKIPRVTLKDEAEYMCEAKNVKGVARTMAELLVESKQQYKHTPVTEHVMSNLCHNLIIRGM